MTTKYQRPNNAYSGATNLENREKYQADSSAQPKVSISSQKMDGDFNYIIDALNTIDDASGSAGTIAARLAQTLNEDGTLKASVVASVDDWMLHDVTNMSRVDGSTLSFDGDHTGVYLKDRRVRMVVAGTTLFAHVESTSFNTPVTTLNLIDVTNSEGEIKTITETPSQLYYSPLITGVSGNSNFRFNNLKSANLKIEAEEGLFIFQDTTASGETYALRSKEGVLEILKNTGSEITPIWTVKTVINENGLMIDSETIITDHIEDAAITTSKISSGVATEGQVLKADGTGGVIYDDIEKPAWEILSTAEIISSVSEVVFTIDSDSPFIHKFIFESLEADTGSRTLEVQFKALSAANNVGYSYGSFNTTGAESFVGNSNINKAIIVNGSSNAITGEMTLSTANNSNDYFSGIWAFSHKSTTTSGGSLASGSFVSTAKNIALDEVRFYLSSGTLESGRIHHLRLKA